MIAGQQFARVFDTPYGQILFYTESNNDENEEQLHQTMTFDGCSLDMKAVYKSEEKCREALESIDAVKAEGLARYLVKVADSMQAELVKADISMANDAKAECEKQNDKQRRVE